MHRLAREIHRGHDRGVDLTLAKRPLRDFEGPIAREFLGGDREAGTTRVPLARKAVRDDVRHGAENARGFERSDGFGGDRLFEEEGTPAESVAGDLGIAAHAHENPGALGLEGF